MKIDSNFGEVGSLREVFAHAKKLRQNRSPQFIMVVEDDPITRRIVTNSFKDNYALITAQNAQEAVADYMMYAPDVVFLDIGLPDSSGFEVLDLLVACDPDAYVVMFSSHDHPDIVKKAKKSGASGFVSKPFKKEDMRGYILSSAYHHNKSCQ